MANALGNFIPVFYARESLRLLRAMLGFGSRINRRYEDERRAFNRGEFINIKRPSSFVATSMGASVAVQDLETTTVNIQLANWYEVTNKLTDKELAFTEETLVREHITPMAYALGRQIDQSVSALQLKVGPAFQWSSPATPTNITQIWEIMMNEECPPGPWNLALRPAQAQDLMADAAFSQQQGAGDQGVRTQRTGDLGMKYGFDTFVTQNIFTTTGITGNVTDTAMAINFAGGYAAGTKTIALDAAGAVDLAAGHTLTIPHTDGTSNSYVVTAASTVAAGAFATVLISPGLRSHVADDAVVTLQAATNNNAAADITSMAFHADALALVMAPLDDGGNGRGAEIFTATDPESGMSVRARRWYEGKEATQYMTLDALWGADVLNGHMAVRLLSA